MAETSDSYVFMSYSRRDEKIMRHITVFLRDQGIKVWVDNERLVPGTPIWEEEIEKAIKATSAVVVVMSPDSKNSEWVRREISLAEQYRKRIFPVLVRGDEDSSMTIRLITRQYVDLRQNEEKGLRGLSTALRAYLEEFGAGETKSQHEVNPSGTQAVGVEKAPKQKPAKESPKRAIAPVEIPQQPTKKAPDAAKPLQSYPEARVAEKLAVAAEKSTSGGPAVRPPFAWKWTVAGALGLFIFGVGAWGISYFRSGSDCHKPNVFCVGLVTDVGKIDDNSFNQLAWQGVQQAQQELGATIQYIETTDAKDYGQNIAMFADAGYDVIVTVGFLPGDATLAAASTYPNIKFIGIEQFQNAEIPNLVSLEFSEDQAGFLAGALAAMMSQSHVIGAVCGTDAIPPIWQYGAGYKAGAAYADARMGYTTEVLERYHSDVGFDQTFTDPDWGAATAQSLINQGADVIFGCGGLTGNGAVTAAAKAGAYAIGNETDQYLTLPEAAPRMLSSAIKLITPGVFELIKRIKEGNFPVGNYYGATGYAPFHDLDSEIPAEVATELERIDAGLADGSIKTNVPPAKP